MTKAKFIKFIIASVLAPLLALRIPRIRCRKPHGNPQPPRNSRDWRFRDGRSVLDSSTVPDLVDLGARHRAHDRDDV